MRCFSVRTRLLDYDRGQACPHMSPHETERLNFGRQIVYARPISVLLALIAVVEQPTTTYPHYALSFLIGYLVISLLAIPAEWVFRSRRWHLPLTVDLLELAA